MSGTWIVLPTYDEAENLEPLVAALPADCRVLVVDDSSPDGTGRIADRLAAAEPDRVHVLHRARKEGLGRAYLAGFAHALAAGAERVVEMDADFSHDPADVPRLVAASAHADVVIGSRYVRGGRIENWGAGRRALSRGGSLYAAALLGLRVRDLTGGFKCFRRSVLETIVLGDVRANGYAFQIEMTYRAVRAGFSVHEVPITFRERRAGGSKMTADIATEAVWQVPALRWTLRRRLVTSRGGAAGAAPVDSG